MSCACRRAISMQMSRQRRRRRQRRRVSLVRRAKVGNADDATRRYNGRRQLVTTLVEMPSVFVIMASTSAHGGGGARNGRICASLEVSEMTTWPDTCSRNIRRDTIVRSVGRVSDEKSAVSPVYRTVDVSSIPRKKVFSAAAYYTRVPKTSSRSISPAVSTEHRLVTHRQTDRQTDTEP